MIGLGVWDRSRSSGYIYFFFFQAEDGIRDLTVTGVQTCALPIWSSLDATEAAVRVLEDDPHFNAGKGSVFTNVGTNEMDAAIMDGKALRAGARSEERRVGKECRSRWSPYH